MNQQINEAICYLCDTSLSFKQNTDIGPKEDLHKKTSISTVHRYLPNIDKWQFDLICQSCLNYIISFDKIRSEWENNEPIFKQKTFHSRFKDLNASTNQKRKKGTHICRLCLMEIVTQEVTFVYHDDKIYQTNYVHKIISLHSPHTDLSLTENPVICNECLDAIQTFDAFHQMCLQVQKNKVLCTDDGEEKQCIENTDINSSGDVNIDDNMVPGQNLSRHETAVDNLSNIEAPHSEKDFLNYDICIISDDEDIETQIDNSRKIGGRTDAIQTREAENAVRGLLDNESLVDDISQKTQSDVCLICDDEYKERQSDSNQNLTPVVTDTRVKNIPLKEYAPEVCNERDGVTQIILKEGLSYGTKCINVESSFRDNEQNLDINKDECKDRKQETKEELSVAEDIMFIEENSTSDSSTTVIDEKLVKAVEYPLVEIEDSDSQDSDDCKEVNTPLLSKNLNVCSIDENNDVTVNENMFQEQVSLPSTDYVDEPSAEIIPSIEINMTKVKELFQNYATETNEVVDKPNESEEVVVSSEEISMSKPKELFNSAGTISTNEKRNLEEKLSDFLQFNKPRNAKRNIDVSNELLDFQHCHLESNGPQVKTLKIDKQSSIPPKNEYTFFSAFEDYVGKKPIVSENCLSSDSLSCDDPKDETKNPILNQIVYGSTAKSDVIILDDDTDKNLALYCKWFPYDQHISDRQQNGLRKSRRKIKATVMESLSGSRIYRCNKCNLTMEKEHELITHHCSKSQKTQRYKCWKNKCSFSTHHRVKLSLHSVFHNLEESAWLKCSICEFHTLYDDVLGQHHKSLHQMGIVQNNRCTYCYFGSDNPEILSHHIRTRHQLNKTTHHINGHHSYDNISNFSDRSFKQYKHKSCDFF